MWKRFFPHTGLVLSLETDGLTDSSRKLHWIIQIIDDISCSTLTALSGG